MTFQHFIHLIEGAMIEVIMGCGISAAFAFFLWLVLRIWRAVLDKAIENYRFQQRFKQMRECSPNVIKVRTGDAVKVRQEENNERK